MLWPCFPAPHPCHSGNSNSTLCLSPPKSPAPKGCGSAVADPSPSDSCARVVAAQRWPMHTSGPITGSSTADTNWHPHQQFGMRGQGPVVRHTPCSPEQGWNRGAVPPAFSAATTAITEQDNNSDRGAQRLSSTSQWHLKRKGALLL